MDLATILGLLATIGMMAWAMFLSSNGDMAMFADMPSGGDRVWWQSDRGDDEIYL